MLEERGVRAIDDPHVERPVRVVSRLREFLQPLDSLRLECPLVLIQVGRDGLDDLFVNR